MVEKAFKKLLTSSIIFLIPLFPVTFLYSQTQTDIERATREVDRLGSTEQIEKQMRRIPKKPVEELKTESQPVAEGEKVFVKKINLVGCEALSPEDFAAIVAKYENKEISLKELTALAKEIEQEYLRLGVIAAVFIPAQESKDQTVTLNVIEAKMGELQIQKHKYFSNKRLKYYWDIMPGETVRYEKISKSLQMMSKNPDREVKAALTAGKYAGTTDVFLTPKTRFPAHVTASFDNEGTPITGRARKGLGMRHNNFLGLDDTFIGGYNYSKESRSEYWYHSLPINYTGASILYGYSYSKSSPKEEYTENILRSKMDNTSFSIHQDLYKKDEYLGEIFAGFEASDKTITQYNGVYSRDRLRIVRLGGSFMQKGFGNVTVISPELSQGTPWFGASSRGNPLASRHAKSNFTKLNLDIQNRRILPLGMQGNFKVRTQVASTKLTPQQEFGLGGLDTVRGYPPSDFQADSAAVANAELLIPNVFIPRKLRLPYAKESLREQITPVVFTDYGWGMRRGAAVDEAESVNFVSLGAGLRFKFFDQALMRLEWGVPLGHQPLTAGGHSRFHFSVDFQDKLPEEIERIAKIREEENIKQLAWQLIDDELNKPDSPIRKKMDYYLKLADNYYKRGYLKGAREYYAKIDSLGKSLYEQTEQYVKTVASTTKGLKEKNQLALADYKEGNLEGAKKIWQAILNDAKPKPLIIEF